ncbi:MAG: hypothetical protein QM696_05145 [Steroidobacteraceae bacterium]
MRNVSLLLVPLALAACSREPSPAADHPAASEVIASETELLRLTLNDEAQQRLGIETTAVTAGSLNAVRQVAGEIVVPPTSAGGIPTGSKTDLQQIGALQAAADSELARAEAQARLASTVLERAEGLVNAEAGSIRARDEAAAALASAQAALTAAREQRRLLGPSVSTMNQQAMLWVRVSVYAGDLDVVQRNANATVRTLGAAGAPREARPVQAPPSANNVAGTIDLFYAVPNTDRALRVGQRVAVDLPLGTRTSGLSVPRSAIVRDIYGGEWVYVQTAPRTYVRQRIEVAAEREGLALLERGLAEGVQVVTAGAAELFGTEFGAAH